MFKWTTSATSVINIFYFRKAKRIISIKFVFIYHLRSYWKNSLDKSNIVQGLCVIYRRLNTRNNHMIHIINSIRIKKFCIDLGIIIFLLINIIKGSRVVKLSACGARGPGIDSRSRYLNFQRLVISCFQVAIWRKYRSSDVNPQYNQQPTNIIILLSLMKMLL